MAEIVLNDVRKVYGNTVVVENLTYTVRSGEFITLLGPSGCGKSTTLNMIAGLEEISGGSITIGGQRVEDLPPHKRDLAFVFQDYALYPHMSVYDNMAFGLRMRKTPKAQIEERVLDAARKLDIGHLLDRKPRALSGGQRQRVALGRAIARRPAVFLFDEPLSNLDALLRDQTRSELKRLHRELAATSIYVTHDQEEALTLSDGIAVMSRGRLEQFGTPEQVYHHPATEFVASFVGKPSMNLFSAHREQGQFIIDGAQVYVSGRSGLPDKVRVGIRPEELRLSANDSASAPAGLVQLVEPVGNATDITVEIDRITVVVRVDGFARFQTGDKVHLETKLARLHFFDPETGCRIGD